MTRRRAALLREMGLAPIWRLRHASDGGADGEAASAAKPSAPADTAQPAAAGVAHSAALASVDVVGAPPQSAPSGEQRQPPPPSAPPLVGARATPAASETSAAAATGAAPAAVAAQDARATAIATLDWDALEASMRECTACGLCRQRKQAVPGVGDRCADWMFVGEGPGAEEDRRGEPFVGPAGKLLDAMLASIGLARGEGVYIANAVKCRPEFNRTPDAGEISACLPYLERQIALVRPRLLVALGRPAAQALLGTDVRINAVRGQLFRHGDIPVAVTYHPAYLLRNHSDKAKAWEDLCFVRRAFGKATDP